MMRTESEMTKASDAMLRMLTSDIRTRMIEETKRRYDARLATRGEFERLVRDVARIEDEILDQMGGLR